MNKDNIDVAIVGRIANFSLINTSIRTISRKFKIRNIYIVYWDNEECQKDELVQMIGCDYIACINPIVVVSTEVIEPEFMGNLLELDSKGFRNFFRYNYLYYVLGEKLDLENESDEKLIISIRPDLVLRGLQKFRRKATFIDEMRGWSDCYKISDKCFLGNRRSFSIRCSAYLNWFSFYRTFADIPKFPWRNIPTEERFLYQLIEKSKFPYLRSHGFSYINRGQPRRIIDDLREIKIGYMRLFLRNYKLPDYKK